MYKLCDLIPDTTQRHLFNSYAKRLGIELPMKPSVTKKGTRCNMLYISKMLFRRIKELHKNNNKPMYANSVDFDFIFECMEHKFEKMQDM